MTYDWYGYLIALGQVEIPLGAIYLAIFNRRNRQSVHDILAQTFVVHRKTGEAVRARSTWPIHYWVLLLIGVAYSYHYVDQFTPPAPHFHPSRPNEWKQGETAIQAIQTIARTGSAGGSYFHFFNVQNESEPTFFLTAELDSRPTNPESTAARIVAAVLAALPDAKSVDKIEIEIEYGYHIGIDADWHAVKLVHTPVEWMRIASRPPVSRRKTHALHAGGQAIGGRALQWLARRDVTWAVPPDFPTAEKVSVRGEIRWSGRADARAS